MPQKPNNVIDLATRRKQSQSGASGPVVSGPVVDMTERRNEMLVAERRQVKRTILSEFIGACAVVPNHGLSKVVIHDISTHGLAFDMDLQAGHFKEGDEVALRVYLNHQTYFGFVCTVSNAREIESEGICRHGANFVKDTVNDKALYHFVKFIETISASLHKDTGDIMVSNLTR